MGLQCKDRQEIQGKLSCGQKARVTQCWPRLFCLTLEATTFSPDSWNPLLKIKTKSYESGLQPTKGVFYLVTMF